MDFSNTWKKFMRLHVHTDYIEKAYAQLKYLVVYN